MRKKFIILCLLLTVGLVSACGKETPPQTQTPQTPAGDTQDDYEAGPQIELFAYDAVEDQQYITIYELQPDQEVTPENVAKAYQTQVMEGVYGQAVGINEVRVDGQRVYIDFKAADVEALGLGSGSEGSYFGNLAASIAANIPDIEAIYYSMDGNDFVTGHLWFDKDEPFWYPHEAPEE